ncbi:MAG: lipopolysaccharide biosynthesis protein [Haloarculaceae archaeon]
MPSDETSASGAAGRPDSGQVDGPGGAGVADAAGGNGGPDGSRVTDRGAGRDPAVARLDDALERVAHGATVSVPSILVQRGLTVAFTAVLTNGFAAGAYGVFAVTRRLQRFLLHLSLGFGRGLSRYLPTADSTAERDALVTVASMLLVGVATVSGAALYLAAPAVTRAVARGAQFRTLLRVFALGLPASVWLFAMVGVLRGIEAVGPLNLAFRVGFPAAQLLVGVVGTVVYGDLLAVAAGVVSVMGLVGVAVAAWLVRERGYRPRLRVGADPPVWRRYVRFTLPLFFGGIATTVQRLGFYPLIAVFLTDVAGGVFAVGMLVGVLVRLPLVGINQFFSPVAAALYEEGHHEALARLYHVTSRLVLVGVTGLAVPVVVYREAVMGLFGAAFVGYAPLLSGFVLAQFAACAAGSVGILLTMTDNQRAYLVVNVAITLVLAVTAVPLTAAFGLPGLVASFVLMLALNNGVEVAVLYRLEGLQPFTRLHARPLAAAVPLAAVALAAKWTVPGPLAPAAGVALGLVAYAATLRWFGFTPVERRLAGTLADRYRAVLGRHRPIRGRS